MIILMHKNKNKFGCCFEVRKLTKYTFTFLVVNFINEKKEEN
jgi:hypothetical protein